MYVLHTFIHLLIYAYRPKINDLSKLLANSVSSPIHTPDSIGENPILFSFLNTDPIICMYVLLVIVIAGGMKPSKLYSKGIIMQYSMHYNFYSSIHSIIIIHTFYVTRWFPNKHRANWLEAPGEDGSRYSLSSPAEGREKASLYIHPQTLPYTNIHAYIILLHNTDMQNWSKEKSKSWKTVLLIRWWNLRPAGKGIPEYLPTIFRADSFEYST